MKRNSKIIAFSHIPKTAGLTLVYLLRRHFGWHHMGVMYRGRKAVYTLRDLRLDLKVHPHVASMTGHSLKPFVEFEEFESRLVWYTILRDPVRRFISHYQHEVEKGGKTHDFHTWMKTFKRYNWQVRMLAFEEDLAAAKQILKEKMLCVGLQEQFDASLLIIRERLGLKDFDVRYPRSLNVAKGNMRKRIMADFEEYREAVIANNELDVRLYDYAVKEIWPKQVAEYGLSRLQKDLEAEFARRRETMGQKMRRWQNQFYRNVVYKPFLFADRRLSRH